jgi:hypothetical protein
VLQTGTKGPVPEGAPRRPREGPLVPAGNRAGTKGDEGMPVGYPRISIPGPAHYGGGLEQGLEDDFEAKKEGSNLYSTRTLVNP